MEIKLRVPHWVEAEDEGLFVLFAFIRRIVIEYQLSGKAIDMYGYDLRRILGREDDNIHEYINAHVNPDFCKIGKLNSEHFVFICTDAIKNTNIKTITNHRSQYVWAYLMGCSNYNLLEKHADLDHRPQYTPMYRIDRQMFETREKKK